MEAPADQRLAAPRRARRRINYLPYVLVAPLIIFIAALVVLSDVLTTVESFFIVNPLNPPTRFTGLANFQGPVLQPLRHGELGEHSSSTSSSASALRR